MQTFLPLPDFSTSARCLDRLRLGKQRLEVLQLLSALTEGGGWSNHPAAAMWRGCEGSLADYGRAVCDEWKRRGFRDTIRPRLLFLPVVTPPWLGDPDFHASHRSNLLRKNPEWYGRFGWSEPNTLPYL